MRQRIDFLGLYVQAAAAIAQTLARSAELLSPRERVVFLLAAWTVGAFLTAWPYARRFGGGWRDAVWIGAALSLLVTLPLVPLLWLHPAADRYLVDIMAIGGLVLGAIITASLRGQGRYAQADRELPELEGAPRQVAEEVLARAGLEPVSVRSAPLSTFNALVQGFRKCIVVVDRRAAEALEPRQLAAILAHEAGHIHHGGILPYLAAISLVLTVASLLCARGLASDLGVLDLLAALLLGRVIVSQWLELRCDRFAGRLTSPADLSSALRRLHTDMPRGFAWVVESLLATPVSTHPPLRARLAGLGEGSVSELLWHHLVLWTTAVGLCLLPLCLRTLPPELRSEVPSAVLAVACWSPTVYFVWWFIQGLTLAFAARKLSWAPLGMKGSRRWLLWATLAVWVALLGLMFFTRHPGNDTVLLALTLSTFALALVVTVVALLLGAFRFGTPLMSRRLRKMILEINAALEDGKPAEALALLEAAPARRQRSPWLRLLRGQCLLYLGRLDAAAAALAAPLEDRMTRPSALYLLGLIELLRGDLVPAEEHVRTVVQDSPDNALGWLLLGNIALDAGRHEEAERHLARSCELKERNVPALAIRVVAALEGGRPPEETGSWLEAALASDPRLPGVLAAAARTSLARGERVAATRRMHEAIAELRKHGWLAWIPYYEKRGRQWGLLEDPLSSAAASE